MRFPRCWFGCVAIVLAGLGAAWPAPAEAAAVRIVFQFVDAPGEGFRDAQWGALRMQPMRQAAALWSQRLVASYPGETIRIRIETGDTGIFAGLGGAERTYWNYDGMVGDTVYPAALANHRARRDIEPAFAESNITIQQSLNNVQRPLSWNEKRFYRNLALHEIGHGLGFLTAVQPDGELAVTDNHPNFPMIYDRFLRTAIGGGQPILGLSDSQRATVSRSNRLYWAGPQGVTANGGVRPRLYARPDFVEGSSILHLEGRSHPTALMKTGGVLAPAMTELDLAMLRDMGWATGPLAASDTATLAPAAAVASAPLASAPTPAAFPLAIAMIVLAVGRRQRA